MAFNPQALDARGRNLKAVNDKLRDLIDSLRTEGERWRGMVGPPASRPAPALLTLAVPTPGVNRATEPAPPVEPPPVEAQLARRIQALEEENRRIYDESMATVEQTTHLTNLYVALARLHGTLAHAEVLAAIEEIVVSLIGSEEFAVYELAPSGRELVPSRTVGAIPERVGAVPVAEGMLGAKFLSRQVWVAGEGGHPSAGDPVAVVPLWTEVEPVGALAIFRLLPHKPTLSPFDRELLDLISLHAAIALHLTARPPLPGGARA